MVKVDPKLTVYNASFAANLILHANHAKVFFVCVSSLANFAFLMVFFQLVKVTH